MLLVVIGLTVAAKATEAGGALCGSSGGGGFVVVLDVGSGLVMIGLGACTYTGAAVLVVEEVGGAFRMRPDVLAGLVALGGSVGAGVCARACCGSTGSCWCTVSVCAAVGVAGLPGIGVGRCCPGCRSVGVVVNALAGAWCCCGCGGCRSRCGSVSSVGTCCVSGRECWSKLVWSSWLTCMWPASGG